MVAVSLRSKIIDEARRDAKAFFWEFHHAIGPDGTELAWVTEAWADIRSGNEALGREAAPPPLGAGLRGVKRSTNRQRIDIQIGYSGHC